MTTLSKAELEEIKKRNESRSFDDQAHEDRARLLAALEASDDALSLTLEAQERLEKKLQASEALSERRLEAIRNRTQTIMIRHGGPLYFTWGCHLCDGFWEGSASPRGGGLACEKHNLIDGQPCPAEKT